MIGMAFQIASLMIVFSIVYSGVDKKKHQSSTSLAFVRRIHWWPAGGFPAQKASNAENVIHLMTSSCTIGQSLSASLYLPPIPALLISMSSRRSVCLKSSTKLRIDLTRLTSRTLARTSEFPVFHFTSATARLSFPGSRPVMMTRAFRQARSKAV